MGKLRWYKRDPIAWLHGTRTLSAELRGYYADIIELIMSHDGALDDDEDSIAWWLRCSVGKWRKVRQQLVDAGKIHIESGQILNERCSKEAKNALNFIEKCEVAGKKSGEIRRSKSTKSTGCAEPTFEGTPELTTTTSISKRKKDSPSESPKKENLIPTPERQKPRSPCPWLQADDVPADMIRYADELGLSGKDVAEQFTHYWTNRAKDPLNRDWQRTWKNWCRRDADKLPKASKPKPQSGYGFFPAP